MIGIFRKRSAAAELLDPSTGHAEPTIKTQVRPLPDRFPRVRDGVSATIEIDGSRYACRARELSLTGCLVEKLERAVDGEVGLELDLGSTTIVSRARVARRQSVNGGFELALAFDGLAWADVCTIAKFLAPKL